MNRPDNELLSAYLDGELTADEQADVERLLAASPAARRLLDELRALSATLQALPQEKLGVDLSDQILHAAQRRILTGQHEPPRPRSHAALDWLRGHISRRTLAWPAVAVVMALVVTLIDRPQPEVERRVAVARKADDSKRDKVAQRDMARGREPPRLEAPREDIVAKRPAVKLADEEPAGAGRFAGVEMKRADLADQSSGTTDAPNSKNDVGGWEQEGIAQKGMAAPGAKWREKGQFGDDDKAGKAHVARGTSPERLPDENKLAMKTAPGGATAINGEGGGVGGAVTADGLAMNAPTPGKAGEGQKAEGGAGRQKQQPSDADSDAGILVVQCDLNPAAATTDAFVQLLADNKIAFTNGRNDDFAGQAMREADALRRDGLDGWNRKLRGVAKDGDTAALAEGETAAGASPAESSSGDNVRAAQSSKRLPNADGLDLVYVEATTTQINGVLASMAKSHDVYYSVSVEPAPGAATQEQYRTYTRRGGQQRQAESRELNEADRSQFKESGEKKALDGGALTVADGERAGRAWRIAALNGGQVASDLSASRSGGPANTSGIAVLEEDPASARPEPTQMAGGIITPGEPRDHRDGKSSSPKADAPSVNVAATPPPVTASPAPPASAPAPLVVPVAPATPAPDATAPAAPRGEPQKPADDMPAPGSRTELATNELPKPAARPERLSGSGTAGQTTEESRGRPIGPNAGPPAPAGPVATKPATQAVQPGMMRNLDELEKKKAAEQPTHHAYLPPAGNLTVPADATPTARAPVTPTPGKPEEKPLTAFDAPAAPAKGVGAYGVSPGSGLTINGTASLAQGQAVSDGRESLQRVLFVLRAAPNPARVNASVAAPAAKASDPARPHAAELERHAKPAAEAAPAQK